MITDVRVFQTDTASQISSLTQLVGSQKEKLNSIVDGLKPRVLGGEFAAGAAFIPVGINFYIRKSRSYFVRISGTCEGPNDAIINVAISKVTDAPITINKLHGIVLSAAGALGTVAELDVSSGYNGFSVEPPADDGVASFYLYAYFTAQADGVASFNFQEDTGSAQIDAGLAIELLEVNPIDIY